ncbi:MAG: IS110 family transposase [Rhizobiales bacterium]|nr:IS110 family transposase [Hyphomicrobiales bacterium]
MQPITTGLDLAKHVFQVHGVGAGGEVVLRKKLRRSEVHPLFAKLPPCLIGMEACPSAHYWARELSALGHTVRLMPAAYVKPYVKRGKSDAIDAEAICEAVGRPTMRFVPAKSAVQQSIVMLHRTRDLLVRQRTMLANALRGHLAEFGIVAAQGIWRLSELLAMATAAPVSQLPSLARECLALILAQAEDLQRRIGMVEQSILAWHKHSKASQRLQSIPGIGFITATAIAAFVPDATIFKSGRQFAAWLGLTPRLRGTGGKVHLGRISKAGDGNLRRLLVLGGAGQGSAGAASGMPAEGRQASCAVPGINPKRRHGSAACSRAGQREWPRSPSPTSWRASPGRYSAVARTSGIPPGQRQHR